LADKDRFARAFAEQMLTYALGRPVGLVDNTTLDRLTAALADNEYRIQALLTAIVRQSAPLPRPMETCAVPLSRCTAIAP
jgi:hypothetical protein